jgi:hypothetical protein
MLTRDAHGKVACPTAIARPEGTLLDRALGERPLVRPNHLALVLQAITTARWRQDGRWIESLAPWVRALRSSAVRSRESTRALVHVFRHLRPLLMAGPDRCVLDSLALLKFLSLCHADLRSVSWVVGVQVRPWSAHSWLQRGDLVINDTPEKVRAYKPILVV